MVRLQNAFIDVETCGLHGLAVLIQYAYDDGEINLFEPWHEPVHKTLRLIEAFMECNFIGFNIVFDHFHLCKMYTIWLLLQEKFGPDCLPIDHIAGIALMEQEAMKGPCLKPVNCHDIMLHCRKGPFQSLMERGDIRIKRVPSTLAEPLAEELEKRVQLDGIYFARTKDKDAPRWRIYESRNHETGDPDPAFSDVVLKFAPSGALKVIAEHVLKLEKKALKFKDIELGKNYNPEELGYAPYALAVGTPADWKGAWPSKIKFHIDHWRHNPLAREYARDDIVYTRGLYYHFGRPEPGDDDSVLACMVAAVRWHGFAIDTSALEALREHASSSALAVPTAPHVAKVYINSAMSSTEQAVVKGSTKRIILEALARMECDCVLEDTPPEECKLCKGGRIHPAGVRAGEVLNARKQIYKRKFCDKLIRSKRFHASLRIIGALSSRMSGADGLNPQGIDHSDEMRDSFILADSEYVLCGGDFDSFEAVLADADYNDPGFRAALVSGQKIHILFARCMFPGKTDAEIKASKGSSQLDMYDQGKKGVYSQLYYGDENTLIKKNNCPEEVAKAACLKWRTDFPGIGVAQDKVRQQFCSIKQDRLGGPIQWNPPAEYIESITGFRRYFTLENQICEALFKLAQNPPQAWKDLKIKIVRRQDRGVQGVCGALQSALFGAAFAIQAAAMRAAGNHRIQSSGATITKNVQRKIWDIQPAGIHKFRVIPLNVHDEIMAPTLPEYTQAVKEAADSAVASFKDRVPLIKMEFDVGLKSWSKGLTQAKAFEVMARDGEPAEVIAKSMKIEVDQVSNIREGRSWAHLKRLRKPSTPKPSLSVA